MASFWRPTWADIDPGAFKHNLRALAAFLPRRVKLMAVLKADAYGHGASTLARAAAGAQLGERLWGFGVSSVEEGVALRDAGVRERILLLGSLYPFESYDVVLERGLTPTVAGRASALALSRRAARRRRSVACHVKVDTGMGRIGFAPATARDVLPVWAANPWLRVEGVFTHLACADNPAATAVQLKSFGEAVAGFSGGLRHVANSQGLLTQPATWMDLVRPGLALYGVSLGAAPRRPLLQPVLSWKSRVVFVKTVRAGTPLSYGWAWRARRRSRIATLPVGYADGYARALSNRGTVLVGGRRCPVVGRVTMDQILVDVTGVPAVEPGAEAVLIGAQGRHRLTVEDMAAAAGTIPYETLCGISRRVPRVVRGSA